MISSIPILTTLILFLLILIDIGLFWVTFGLKSKAGHQTSLQKGRSRNILFLQESLSLTILQTNHSIKLQTLVFSKPLNPSHWYLSQIPVFPLTTFLKREQSFTWDTFQIFSDFVQYIFIISIPISAFYFGSTVWAGYLHNSFYWYWRLSSKRHLGRVRLVF